MTASDRCARLSNEAVFEGKQMSCICGTGFYHYVYGVVDDMPKHYAIANMTEGPQFIEIKGGGYTILLRPCLLCDTFVAACQDCRGTGNMINTYVEHEVIEERVK